MIHEAIHALEGTVSNREIRNYINSKYDGINPGTINCQIIACTVNRPSRINFPENHKPRNANGNYDFLYTVGKGKVTVYKPEFMEILKLYSIMTSQKFHPMGKS